MRKQCKRRVWALVNPIQHAMEGASYTPEQYLERLRLLELAAIDAFAHGRARIQEWRDISNMLNLTETMARRGIGPEALEACERAQAALIDAQQRYERTKKMGLTGPGLQALRDLYAFHDLQRQSVSRSQYEAAIRDTANRIRSKAPEVVEL